MAEHTRLAVAHRRRAKIGHVMGEFKRGSLKSSSGARVSHRRQAIAIALSEAGLSRRQVAQRRRGR